MNTKVRVMKDIVQLYDLFPIKQRTKQNTKQKYKSNAFGCGNLENFNTKNPGLVNGYLLSEMLNGADFITSQK